MKPIVKRSFSLVLVLVICLSLLPSMSLSAATNDWIPNWGSRGTVATALSANAEAFYSRNGVSYEELSQYLGGSTTDAAPGSELYGVLQNLMRSNHTYITSYKATTSMYAYTDCQNGDYTSDGAISSFYSGRSIGPAWDGGGTWNREHTWPNSKGLAGDDENDIMMLRPTSVSENSSRGNTAYGESGGYYNPNETSGGRYNLHGDVARIALYVYVRWGNTRFMWGEGGVIESLDVLLKWMEEDPVDTWELGRNDAVESITGTRNVFVDFPELGFLLFNAEIPANMTTPSGKGAGTNYTITATVNNEEYGSLSVSGRNITAIPAEGYKVAGYTVVSGSASVQRNGNVFVVSAESDCTIQINFELKNEVTAWFSENGVVTGSAATLSGDMITMPSTTVAVPEGYSFRGWITYPIVETSQMPSTIYQPGQNVAVDSSLTFYALYARADETASGGADLFERYSGALTEGDYLIVDNGGAMKAAPTTAGRIDFDMVTESNGAITAPESIVVWHIAPASNGYWTIYNASTGYYASSTENTKNKAQLDTAVTDRSLWTVSGSGSYEFKNKANEAAGINSHLRRNNDYGYACYSSQTGAPLTLYKSAGSFLYTTGAEEIVIPNEITLDAAQLGDVQSVWLDGREYPVITDGDRVYVDFEGDNVPTNMVTYTYHVGDAEDVHTQYPTGMQVWTVHLSNGTYVAQRHEGLDNILQYSGSSIRISGKKGIRMITSVNKDTKAALTGKGIDGYTLVEYGTVLGWASALDEENALVLGKEYAKSNYAYRKGVADPIFATSGDLVQYTNVLVGFSLDQCKDDIAMRPYIILEDAAGNRITIYGGVIYRSIGYIAYQNRNVFKPKTGSYDYVWEIIHHVYGDQYDADYKG